MPYRSQARCGCSLAAWECSAARTGDLRQWACATCPRGMRVCDSAGVIHGSSARVCMRVDLREKTFTITPLFHNVGHIALRADKSPKACSWASGSSII
eukprot:scaffold16777_cov62-Phaeocystis_antarctica.AAC.1